MLLFLIHFGFSFYAYIKFSKMMEEHTSTDGHFSSFSAGTKFFLYDVGMCIYLFVIVGAIVWNIIGVVWIDESQCVHLFIFLILA